MNEAQRSYQKMIDIYEAMRQRISQQPIFSFETRCELENMLQDVEHSLALCELRLS